LSDKHIEIFITDLNDRAHGKAIYLTEKEAAIVADCLEFEAGFPHKICVKLAHLLSLFK
jgi:hypothetical protein